VASPDKLTCAGRSLLALRDAPSDEEAPPGFPGAADPVAAAAAAATSGQVALQDAWRAFSTAFDCEKRANRTFRGATAPLLDQLAVALGAAVTQQRHAHRSLQEQHRQLRAARPARPEATSVAGSLDELQALRESHARELAGRRIEMVDLNRRMGEVEAQNIALRRLMDRD